MGIYDGPVYGQPLPPQARPTYTDQERRAARNQGLLALAAAIGSDAPLGQALAGGVSGGLSAESGYLARIMAERERAAAMARQRMLEDFQAKVAERDLAAKEDLWKHQGELRPLEIQNTQSSIDSNRASIDSSKFSLEQAQAAAKRLEEEFSIYTPAEQAAAKERLDAAQISATNRSGVYHGDEPRPLTPEEKAIKDLQLAQARISVGEAERAARQRAWAGPVVDEEGKPLLDTASPNWLRAFRASTGSGLSTAEALRAANLTAAEMVEQAPPGRPASALIKEERWSTYEASTPDAKALKELALSNRAAYEKVKALIIEGKTDEAAAIIKASKSSPALAGVGAALGVLNPAIGAYQGYKRFGEWWDKQ